MSRGCEGRGAWVCRAIKLSRAGCEGRDSTRPGRAGVAGVSRRQAKGL